MHKLLGMNVYLFKVTSSGQFRCHLMERSVLFLPGIVLRLKSVYVIVNSVKSKTKVFLMSAHLLSPEAVRILILKTDPLLPFASFTESKLLFI